MKIAGALVTVLLCTGCATSPAPSMNSAPMRAAYEQDAPQQSLFAGDDAVLSDADIDRILKFNYVLPRQARVAVLPLGQEFWFAYSDELARSGKEIRDRFVSKLRTAPVVVNASYLPSLLVPKNRTVAYLREAATRYQADLLVIYQSSCRTYEKYRLFSANTTKSFCNVEALLLDVRTGIVPFTTIATEEFKAEENKNDTSFYETMRRAELAALGDALVRVGDEIAGYLSKSKAP